MRILYDARALETQYENRGVGYYVKNILRALPAAAPDIHFLILCESQASAQHIPDAPNIEPLFIHRSWRRQWLEDIIKLHFEIKGAKVSLFHCPIVLGPISSINIPFASSTPIVSTIHDLHVEMLDDPYMIAYRRELRYRLQRRAVERTYITTVSECTRKLLEQQGIRGKGDIRVIPNGITPREFPQETKENTILFIGETPHKNVSAAISVFTTIAEKFAGWNFIMVGKKSAICSLGGVYAEDLIRSGRLKIMENVSEENLEKVYKKVKVLFMPSLSEGFGVPVLEAFANGVCPVISDIGALPEVGGDAAVYVDPRDYNEMVSSLEGVIHNESIQQVMATNGRDRMYKFLWEDRVEELVSFYREIIENA